MQDTNYLPSPGHVEEQIGYDVVHGVERLFIGRFGHAPVPGRYGAACLHLPTHPRVHPLARLPRG